MSHILGSQDRRRGLTRQLKWRHLCGLTVGGGTWDIGCGRVNSEREKRWSSVMICKSRLCLKSPPGAAARTPAPLTSVCTRWWKRAVAKWPWSIFLSVSHWQCDNAIHLHYRALTPESVAPLCCLLHNFFKFLFGVQSRFSKQPQQAAVFNWEKKVWKKKNSHWIVRAHRQTAGRQTELETSCWTQWSKQRGIVGFVAENTTEMNNYGAQWANVCKQVPLICPSDLFPLCPRVQINLLLLLCFIFISIINLNKDFFGWYSLSHAAGPCRQLFGRRNILDRLRLSSGKITMIGCSAEHVSAQEEI